MSERFHRRSIRLRGYDYANEGAYYVTICTHERWHSFGRIIDGVMHPSPLGDIVQRCWDAIPEHMPHVDNGDLVVMPNYMHGVVIIRERRTGRDPVGADHDRPQTTTTTEIPDAPNDRTGDTTADAPRAPMRTTAPIRADHDQPLRPPPDPGARPPTPMPIVPVGSLGRFVRAFRSAVTRAAYHDGLLPRGTPVWQRNYFERIIRDVAEYDRIARYIADNPANLEGDRFNER